LTHTPKDIIHNSQRISITFSLNFSLTINFYFTAPNHPDPFHFLRDSKAAPSPVT